MKDVITEDFLFYANETPPVVGSPDGSFWRSKITKTAGSPTVVAAGGEMVLTLDNANEIQNLCVYFGDILSLDIDDLLQVDFWVRCTASLNAAISLAFGLISARNDAIDSITEAALFRVLGDGSTNPVTVETDDGTNNNDDKAAGQVLVATTKRFTIDFASGLKTVSPPSPSVGGKANVLFSMDDGRGNLLPVCRNVAFDMSNYSSGLQLFAQLQKTADAATGSLYVKRIRVRRKMP